MVNKQMKIYSAARNAAKQKNGTHTHRQLLKIHKETGAKTSNRFACHTKWHKNTGIYFLCSVSSYCVSLLVASIRLLCLRFILSITQITTDFFCCLNWHFGVYLSGECSDDWILRVNAIHNFFAPGNILFKNIEMVNELVANGILSAKCASQ